MPLDNVTEPMQPTPHRGIRCGRRLHAVTDAVVTADLARQLNVHVSPTWYAVVMFSDGEGVAMPCTPALPAPPDNVIAAMSRWAVALNAQLHNNGHWVVAWSDAQEPVLLWRDADGDPHCVIELRAKPETIDADYDEDRILNMACKGLTEAMQRLALLDLSRGETVKRALRRTFGGTGKD